MPSNKFLVDEYYTQFKSGSVSFIDDLPFKMLMSNPKVCQCLISAILEREMEIIGKIDTSFAIDNLNNDGHSVVLDVLCKEKNGNMVNVEMQKARGNIDHLTRVDYYASMMKVKFAKSGDYVYAKIPKVTIIYLTDFDVFKEGEALYHITETILETGKKVDMGREFIFVNIASQKNKIVCALSRLLKTGEVIASDYTDPNLADIARGIDRFKTKGENEMRYSRIFGSIRGSTSQRRT